MNNSDSTAPARRAPATTPASRIPAGIGQHYLAECESLRGIAILLVILFHAYLKNAKDHPLEPNILNGFIISGNTGVTLFFVLSGFLLSLPFFREQAPSTGAFFRNRALRILPMYVIMVAIGGIYHRDIASTLQALFFWNLEVGTLWPYGSVWWSLMVEVQFYLLLPLFYLVARSPRLRWLVYPAFIAGCFSYLLFTGRLPWKPDHFYFIAVPRNSILCVWPVFFLGGLLAWVHSNYRQAIGEYAARSRFLSGGGADLIVLAILLALGAILLKVSRLGILASYVGFFDHVVIEAALWTLLIAAILYLPLKTKFLWSNPLLSFFGLISYSLYLIHFPVLFFGMKYVGKYQASLPDISKPVFSLIFLVAATALSLLTYQLIEKPALRLKHRGGARGAPLAAAPFSSVPDSPMK